MQSGSAREAGRQEGHTDAGTGARYGPRKDFEPYAAQAGTQMRCMDAEQTLFIADGA